ncbi:MAG: hypothetical protein K2Q26_12810 [Bdellovibrionales bacterium]|nr:hypothetical protein [Bdellovibrionales bacterium]
MSSYPFRKIYFVIALTLIASIVFAFDLHAAENKKVNTVTSEDIYTEHIAKTEPLTYSELRQIFESKPSYLMSCVSATTLLRPKRELLETFKTHRPNASPSLTLTFMVEEQGDGFNIYLSRETQDFAPETALSCERTKEHRCSSIKMVQERTIPFVKEGFAPDAVVLEKFQFYPQVNGSMYAKYEFSITGSQYDFWNRPSHKVNLDLSYICKVSRVTNPENPTLQRN